MNILFKHVITTFVVLAFVSCGKDNDSPTPDSGKLDLVERISKTSFVATIEEHEEVQLHAGVRMVTMKLKNQASQPMVLYIIEADLKHPHVAVRAATPDDGEIFKFQQVSAIAAAADKPGNRVLAAVNGDYFWGTGEPWGPVIKRGKVLRTNFRDTWHGFFGITNEKTPVIGSGVNFANGYQHLEEAIGGEGRLINNGSKVSHQNSDRHPRTAVGFDDQAKIYIIVVDGRQPAHSIGMSLGELSEIMFALRTREALNLDGGGSTTLVTKNSSSGFEVMNRYSDAAPRAVANALTVVSVGN